MSNVCFYIAFVVCLVVVFSGQGSARFWRPALPSNPSDPYYEKFQKVPPTNVTVKKFITNFLRIRPSGRRKRQTNQAEDTVVVLDGSGSIGRCEFEKGKRALQNMMGEANLDQQIDSKYAAVTFSSLVTVNFKFLPYSSAANMMASIPYPYGGTNTQAGLVEAKRLFDDPLSGRRINARKVVLLISDGKSNIEESLTIPKAQELKNSGVLIYVVAVGNHIAGIDELVKVATFPPEYYMFRVKELASFWKVVNLSLNEVSPGKYVIADGHFTTPCTYG